MRRYISALLSGKGITVTELAKRLGVHRQTVYCEMDSDLRLSSLLKIAEATGCQVGLYDPDDKKFKRITTQDLKK